MKSKKTPGFCQNHLWCLVRSYCFPSFQDQLPSRNQMLPKWPKPVKIIHRHVWDVYIVYIHTHIHGHCAVMQIPGSEKFPQTRLIPWVFFDCQQRQAPHHPTIFLLPKVLFFRSHRKLRCPSPRDPSTPLCHRVHYSAPVLIKTQIAICSWFKPKLLVLSAVPQPEQRCVAIPFLAPVRLFSSDSHHFANYKLPIMQVLSETNMWITVRTDLAHNWNALLPFFLKPSLCTSFSQFCSQ